MSAPSGRGGGRGSRVASSTVRVIGVCASVVVAVVVVALGLLAADRIPLAEYNVTDGDRFIGLVLAGWTLAIVGFVWLIALAVTVHKRHLRTRALAVPPVLLVTGALVVMTIRVALPDGFVVSRADMDAVVEQARSHHPGWRDSYGYDRPREVGALEIGSVTHREDGVVRIDDADAGMFFEVNGWAHSPDGPPDFASGVADLKVEYLDGPWYAFSYIL